MCCWLPAARGCPRMPGARDAEGAQESKRRQQWTFVTNSAAGKSPGAQVTWKLKRLQPLSAGPQTHNGRGSGGPWPRACTVPQFLPGQGRAVPAAPVQKSRWGGVSRDPDRMEGPSFSMGCPLGKATRGRARCPCSLPSGRVSRSRAGPRAPRLAPRGHWSSRGALYPPGLPSLPEGLLCQGAPVRREKACISQGPKPATRRSPAKQLTK